jgi:hypothetical protein
MTNGRTESRQVVKEISPNTLASARRNLQPLREVPVPPGPKRHLDFEAALDQLGDDRHIVRISGDQQNIVVLSMKLNASSIMAVAIIRIEKQRNNSPGSACSAFRFGGNSSECLRTCLTSSCCAQVTWAEIDDAADRRDPLDLLALDPQQLSWSPALTLRLTP